MIRKGEVLARLYRKDKSILIIWANGARRILYLADAPIFAAAIDQTLAAPIGAEITVAAEADEEW